MTQNKQRRWLVLTLLYAILVYEVSVTDVAKRESKCYADNSFLEPNCGSSPGLVISIDWNATFLGQSTLGCGNPVCCPGDTVCAVLVRDSIHFEELHWDELNDCNGRTTCRVQVQSIEEPCPLQTETDYETVTYRCVAPVLSTSESARSLASEKRTTSWTSPYETASTESTSLYSETSDSSQSIPSSLGLSMTASNNEITGTGDITSATYTTPEPSHGDNIGIIIGVSVVILLVIVILIVITVICNRRKKNDFQTTDVQYRDSTKRQRRPDAIDKTFSHVSRQSICDKNIYGAVNYRASSASYQNRHSDDRKPEPPPSRSNSKSHNSQPLTQSPNGLPGTPADTVYAEPLDVKSDIEGITRHSLSNKSDADYSYTSFNKQPVIYTRSKGTDRTSGSEKAVVNTDILHAQNEEYANGDSNDMEIENNDLYGVTEDGDGHTENIPAGQPVEDDDNDMEIMDNDVYNLSDMSEDEVSQLANHQTEDDDDMVVTENDVYNVRLPGDDTVADSV